VPGAIAGARASYGPIKDRDEELVNDGAWLGSESSRRTFLKAAALGTAAAALWQKGPGLSLGPAAAFADNLSSLNCTANDVRIPSAGIITNEPCNCQGTFTANVVFAPRRARVGDRTRDRPGRVRRRGCSGRARLRAALGVAAACGDEEEQVSPRSTGPPAMSSARCQRAACRVGSCQRRPAGEVGWSLRTIAGLATTLGVRWRRVGSAGEST
jgi:hypothetical protein